MVKTGLDVLLKEGFRPLRGKRVALLANQATVDSRLRHAADLLAESDRLTFAAIFGPEHGFRGELQDMDHVENALDKKTGVPIYSLYGKTAESLMPSPEQLRDIDILVVDLPDIGSRYYTFAQSLGYAMQAAAQAKVQVIVLDRPNPINGKDIEGAFLESHCRSFCGYAPVPNRHGLTLGELALIMQKGFGSGINAIPPIEVDLKIIPVRGWKRSQYFDQTGLPWVLPSPNMPTLDTAIVYPGGCLFEATQISEGRGTTRPFEFIGAPGIDADLWIKAAFSQGVPLAGAALRPISFYPKFQKSAEKFCSGVQIHILSRQDFQPFRWYIALLGALKETHPNIFAWRTDVYEFITSVPTIDLLYGSSHLRSCLDANTSVAKLLPELENCELEFRKDRAPFLLYE